MFPDCELISSPLHHKYIFARGENGIFAINIDGKDLCFQSPAFGVTYITTNEEAKRKFQIEIIETEPNIQCKAITNDQNKLKVVDGGTTHECELYGIVYNHEESVTDLRSNTAVERFVKKLDEILPSIAYPVKVYQEPQTIEELQIKTIKEDKSNEKIHEETDLETVKGFRISNPLQTKATFMENIWENSPFFIHESSENSKFITVSHCES